MAVRKKEAVSHMTVQAETLFSKTAQFQQAGLS